MRFAPGARAALLEGRRPGGRAQAARWRACRHGRTGERGAVKLAYIILAHNRPEQVVELARGLTRNADDARAFVHFDAKAPRTLVDRLDRALDAEPRAEKVQPSVVTGWGTFGLVSSVVNAITQIERSAFEPDYVVLLSGADLPVRPVAQLERFLTEHLGREFIEVCDSSWIVGGLRESRYRLFFPLNLRKHPILHRVLERAQRLLRVRREFPSGLTPRFGSQWWALSWETCRAIVGYLRKHPNVYRFFRTVWIPDEMMFQTLVHRLVMSERIAGHGLTHYQFTDKGKPVVYHNDHADYVLTLERFFVRKCDPDAAQLRARCLAEAEKPDDGANPDPARSRRQDYIIKISAQTNQPQPGHLFYRDQYVDRMLQMVERLEGPLVILTGPRAATDRLAADLDGAPFAFLGELFAPDVVDLPNRATHWRGLRRDDAAIRDMHPALYLERALWRCQGSVPVLVWSWRFHGELLAALNDNPAVTLVDVRPEADTPQGAEALCYASDLSSEAIESLAVGVPIAGQPAALRRARLDSLADSTGFRALRDHLDGHAARTVQRPLIVRWRIENDGQSDAGRAARRFDGSIASAPGPGSAWFDTLTDRLRDSASRRLWADDRAPLVDPQELRRIQELAAVLDPSPPEAVQPARGEPSRRQDAIATRAASR